MTILAIFAILGIFTAADAAFLKPWTDHSGAYSRNGKRVA